VVYEFCRPLVVGDRRRLEEAASLCGLALRFAPVARPADGGYRAGAVDVLDLANLPAELEFGALHPAAGAASYDYVAVATRLARDGEVAAICTAPLSKESLHAAGHIYPGHTELLAELTGTAEVSMMLTSRQLRVIHVTTHIGLLDAIERIGPGLVERTIDRGAAALRAAGLAEPRVAVCGINPHAGENGLFGRGEENAKIAPAVAACDAKPGQRVVGPLPADTLFMRAVRGDFDLVVAMYHDQGHCPVKVLGLDSGVNVTVGLPIVRTSVDHGTAYDIAGTGRAEEASMIEALRQAALLANHRGVAG
ncbi:MAG: 4-hydroxythreonine-4-phosphate dehydrogenase PdxA, partial [Micromonosporaceae bacterium]